jgi:cell division protein FtsX
MLVALEALVWTALAVIWGLMVLGAVAVGATVFLVCNLIRRTVWQRRE